jgi:hypothetical protein
MTVEMVIAFLGVLFSLLFSYIPGLKSWYEKLDGTYKRLVMLLAGLLVVGGAFGLSCAGLLAYFPCTGDGAWQAVQLFFLFAVANQTTYLLSPKSKAG